MKPRLPPADFEAWLRREGVWRYHDRHPFHVRMHAGELSRGQLQRWVANRYYYQTRIPIKDALIVSKSEDPAFRRAWIRRIHDHDGDQPGEGGLELWQRLGEAVGVSRAELTSFRQVLPAARTACDAYVHFVSGASLLEAVAASLTETFAPALMERRISAWIQHYSWVPSEALAYFRTRVTRAKQDGNEALAFVLANAATFDAQERAVAALVRKTEILWALLDAVAAAGPSCAASVVRLHPRSRLKFDRVRSTWMLMYPEGGMALNRTAFEIATLCQQPVTHSELLTALSARYPTTQPSALERDTNELLLALEAGGLLERSRGTTGLGS
ncbi:MAG TPA: pyrroloquinoline-quinone synthase PqqC [Polyangiaceae bacterium]